MTNKENNLEDLLEIGGKTSKTPQKSESASPYIASNPTIQSDEEVTNSPDRDNAYSEDPHSAYPSTDFVIKLPLDIVGDSRLDPICRSTAICNNSTELTTVSPFLFSTCGLYNI